MVIIFLLSSLLSGHCEIIKPVEQWLCDYCSMGKKRHETRTVLEALLGSSWQTRVIVSKYLLKSFSFAGPQENPSDCGTPILCMFYCLLICIVCLTAYTTLKGSLKWNKQQLCGITESCEYKYENLPNRNINILEYGIVD